MPLLLPELRRNHAVDSGADGIARLIDEDAGIVVELDHASVLPLRHVLRSHDDGVPYVASLDLVR